MNDSQPELIALPAPCPKRGMSLAEAIDRRRSVRRFGTQPITQSQLSRVLWAIQGTSSTTGRYRTIPSAGATYPLEIYIACGHNSTGGMDDGIYHYQSENHVLLRHYAEDVRAELSRAALNQEYINQAPVDIVICARYERTTRHYGERGKMYVHIEVGHAGQNIYLQAAALGLATVAIGAFNDEQIREVLRLDGQTKPLYIMPLGWPG
ncbi:SagB/ThcOx family dehydrogenase [Chloroflexota bacterium]